MDNEHLLESWSEQLLADFGLSPNTLSSYLSDLRSLADFSAPKPLFSLDQPDIERFLSHLSRRVRPSTQARKLSCIKQFYLYLFTEGIRPDHPAQTVPAPKFGRALPKILTEQDVSTLLAFAESEVGAASTPSKRQKSLKLHAMLELLYATGLRVSELVGLPKEAGTLRSDFFIVRGKGGRERMVPLGGAAKSALSAYCASVPDWSGTNYLFPSKGRSGHMTRQNFAKDLKSLAVRAGLSHIDISPHILRHAFASHLLQNGAELIGVQNLLGHQDINTTEIYTHILDDKLKDFVQAAHPLAPIKRNK